MKPSARLMLLVTLVLGLGLGLAACGDPEAGPASAPDAEDQTGEEAASEGEAEDPGAESEEASLEPVDGGIVTESTFADASIFNPILASDGASFSVINKLYLGLVTVDAFSGETIPQVAESWEISEDGLTYTFKLRDDVLWSDGTPLTAKDVKFTLDAVASEAVETPRKSNVEKVASVTAVDDHTLEVVLSEVDCTALQSLGLGILPSHLYAEDFSDVMESDENTAPSVVSGPFMFTEWVADDHVSLERNPNYYLGATHVDGWTFRVFADQSAELAALQAGEVDVTGVSPQYVSTIESDIAAGSPLAMEQYFSDGYLYVGFNLADPANPQRGWIDENGNEEYDEGEPPQPQDPHPVLSDIAVRKAVAQAIDYVNIIEKVAFGQGTQTSANVLPAVEWAYDADLEPYAYDVEAAAALLEEAGWIDTDDDGVREKDGTTLSLDLMTNSGNEVRENVATILKDNLDSLGFDINLEIIEFGTMVESMLGQTYDMVIISWGGLGSDPEDSSFWAYRFDDPGSGFNFVSYYNEAVESALAAGRSVPGCSEGDRAPFYKTIQNEIHDDAPYAFMYVPLANRVWNTRVEGVAPGPWSTYYNVEEWFIKP